MNFRRVINSYLIKSSDEFEEKIPTPIMSTNEEDELLKECMLNVLMNLKSKKKIFRIVIDNSNNFMDYSIFNESQMKLNLVMG
jgi:hypothetical protein